MEQPDAVPLVFLAHFQQARLREVENLVKLTEGPEYHNFARTQCDPRVQSYIAALQEKNNELQQAYDRLALTAFLQPGQKADVYLNWLDVWQNQDEVTSYYANLRELEYVRAMTEDIRMENTQMKAEISQLKRQLLKPMAPRKSEPSSRKEDVKGKLTK